MFKQDIGLNAVIFEAPGNFETKVSIVAFAVEGRKAYAKKFLMETTTHVLQFSN